MVNVSYCIDALVDVLTRGVGWRLLMHWDIGGCVELTCWLTFTDALTCWLVCWVDMLLDIYWLMHWCVGWCVEWICWLTFTDTLTYWLIVKSTCYFELFCSTQLLWSVAFGYNKKQEIKAIPLLHIQSWLKSSYCCSHSKKYKTQHNLNRGTMQYIPVKQAW